MRIQLLSLFPKCLQLMRRLCLRTGQGKARGALGFGSGVCLVGDGCLRKVPAVVWGPVWGFGLSVRKLGIAGGAVFSEKAW